MPPTFFGCLPRQKIDQKRHLSSRLSRIHFCDLIHGGGLVFGLHAIVASPAGRDRVCATCGSRIGYFYPRVPCGTRLGKCREETGTHRFLPTRPLRDATERRRLYHKNRRYFYPRVPCGTRQLHPPVSWYSNSISTHASLAGRDCCAKRFAAATHTHFYPRVPCGTRRFRRGR